MIKTNNLNMPAWANLFMQQQSASIEALNEQSTDIAEVK